MFKYILFFKIYLDCIKKIWMYVINSLKKNDYLLSNELIFWGICYYVINI